MASQSLKNGHIETFYLFLIKRNTGTSAQRHIQFMCQSTMNNSMHLFPISQRLVTAVDSTLFNHPIQPLALCTGDLFT